MEDTVVEVDGQQAPAVRATGLLYDASSHDRCADHFKRRTEQRDRRDPGRCFAGWVQLNWLRQRLQMRG